MVEKQKPQLERFKEAARQLETDDDEVNFNENLGKLVTHKPEQKENSGE